MNLQHISPDKWYHDTRFKLLDGVTLQGVTVPSGFVSDGASVPRWLPLLGLVLIGFGHYYPVLFVPGVLLALTLALFPRFGRTLRAAVLHDYLLKQDVDRWHYASVMFLRQLKADGVQRWRCWVMVLFVSLWQCFFAGVRLLRR